MKRCTRCGNTYTDDTLRYCLQDGASLSFVSDASTEDYDQEATLEHRASHGRELPATEILNAGDLPTVKIASPQQTTVPERARATVRESRGAMIAASPRQNNKLIISLLSVIVLLLLALGGLGLWALLKDDKKQQNSNELTTNRGKETQTGNRGAATNINAAATATPQTKQNVDTAAIQKEVTATLNSWAQTIKDKDIDAHMKYYADVLDTYYNASNLSADRVRADRERAFAKYDTLDMKVTNIKVEVEPSGTRATATFDKTFDFTGEKNFSGSGLNRFWLEKRDGRWLIKGEKDLQIYYINK